MVPCRYWTGPHLGQLTLEATIAPGNRMYYDLCLHVENDASFAPLKQKELASFAIKAGFDAIAYNVNVSGRIGKEHTCVLEKLECFSSESSNKLSTGAAMRLELSGRPLFLQLTRLTVELEDASQVHSLTRSNSISASYDLLAVSPMTEKMFQVACATLEVDIITLDLTRRLPFYIKRATAQQAVARGIFFEIVYSGCLKDGGQRRQAISTALSLIRAVKGDGVIVSSGAMRALDLRGPHDVINLCSLFGVDATAAKSCIAANARAVVLHAQTRRATYKTALSVECCGAEVDTSVEDVVSGTKRKASDEII